MSKPKFTFKNYLLEIKKMWLLVAIIMIAGAIVGTYSAFSKPTKYAAAAKVSVFNASLNTGPVTSPYSQISALLMSDELIKDKLESYTVTEKQFGVFEIAAVADDARKAVDTANAVADYTDDVIADTYDDAQDYKVTVLSRASEATPTVTTKNRIISTAVFVAGALALALVIVFIRFDYIAEK